MRTIKHFIYAILFFSFVCNLPTIAHCQNVNDNKLRFDWPVPGKAQVKEVVLKKGKTGITQYDLIINPINDDLIEIKYGNFEFIEINGITITAKLRHELAPIIEWMKILPSFVVNNNGYLVEILGIDDMMKNYYKDSSEKEMKEMETLLKSKTFMNALYNKVADRWNQWVGCWSGMVVREYEKIQFESDIDVFGTSVKVPTTISHEGKDKNRNELIWLKANTEIQNINVLKTMANGIQKGISESGVSAESFPDMSNLLDDFSRKTVITTLTNPYTLQPHYVKSEMTIYIKPKEGEEITQIENHEYWFDWSVNK